MGAERDKVEIRTALNKLVEWRHALNRDREAYNNFIASNRPPEPPEQFESFQDLIDYHRRKMAFVATRTRHESTLATGEAEYEKAASVLREVLPEDVVLHYTYEGGHQAYEGTEYQIVHRQGEVMILAYRGPTPAS